MKGKFPTKLSTKYITKFSTFLLISIITFFTLSCRKYERFFGFVNTNTTLDITSNPKSVTFDAEFIDTGSYEIIGQGHIWSNKRDVPTFAKDNVVPSAKTSVQFSTKIENILPDTTYFARAFAITSVNDTLYTPTVSKRWSLNVTPLAQVVALVQLRPNRFISTIALNPALIRQNPNFFVENNVIVSIEPLSNLPTAIAQRAFVPISATETNTIFIDVVSTFDEATISQRTFPVRITPKITLKNTNNVFSDIPNLKSSSFVLNF